MNTLGKIAVICSVLIIPAWAGYESVTPYIIPDYSEETAVEFDEAGYQMVCHLRCDADKPELPGLMWQYRQPLPGCEPEFLNDDTKPVCPSYYTGQSRARAEYQEGGCDNMFGCF